RLFGRVPRRAFPAQRARADHLRGDTRGAHDPAGRVRPRLSRGPARQEVAAALPAGLKVAAVAAVGVPQRRLNHLDFIVLSLYWVAIGYLWNSLTALILPDMIIHFVGQAHEGVAASFLKSIGTVMAIVWQPIVGGISDRTVTPWGRRRPFIAAGTVGDLLFLAGIALAGNYWWLVLFYFLLQLASNTAQAPYQGLLPDVVPPPQRGDASGYYGVANLVGIASGTVGAGLLLQLGREAAIASIGVVLLTTMLATVVLVPDRAAPVERQFRNVRVVLVFSHYQWVPDSLVAPLARFLKVPDLAAQATLTGLVIGVGLGIFFSVDWAFIQDIIPANQGGLYMGFSNIATAGAGIIAVFIGGPLLDAFNGGPMILGLPG